MTRLLLLITLLGLLAVACGTTNDTSTGADSTPASGAGDGAHHPASPTATSQRSGMDEHGMSGTQMPGMGDMEFDQMFIAGMIPHHQSAIDMAKMARKRAEHTEIKQLTQDIISAQQREIDQMKQWRKAWYGS